MKSQISVSRLQRRYRRIVEVHSGKEGLEVGVGHECGAVASQIGVTHTSTVRIV